MATELDWPATRWSLTAAETHTLLVAPRAADPRTLAKLALMELAVRGSVRVVRVTRRWLRWEHEVAVLVDGGAGRPARGELAAVWDAYRRRRTTLPDGAQGAEVRAVARHLLDAGAFDGGASLRRHVQDGVIARGLAVRGPRTLRGLGRPSLLLTPAGTEARDEATRWLHIGRQQIATWRVDDPARVFAFAGMAGAAVLLLDDALPDVAAALAERRDGSGSSVGEAGDGGPDLDLGALDPDALADLGDLGGAFDLIDAGVDAGGGGDGGGGGDAG